MLDRLIDRAQGWVAAGKGLLDITATRSEKHEFRRLKNERPGWLSSNETAFVDGLQRRDVGTKIATIVAGLTVILTTAWLIASQRQQIMEARATNFWHRVSFADGKVSGEEAKSLRELAVADKSVRLAYAFKPRVCPAA